MSDLKLQQSLLDGRYEILDCLGRGSYAEIYVARDMVAGEGEPRTVVIKALNVLLQGVPDTDLERTLIENFQNEAVALDRVRHPHIISRLGHGTAIDLAQTAFHYIVLEYMAGGELGARCRQQPFSLDRALFYLEQVCSGLAHAHSCGVIHRDIKPQNLLLTADAQIVKIADFGVAKIEATEGAITRVGTNVYAPPEHNPLVQTGPLDTASLTVSDQHLTPAADIYSLAKTTYTLLAGEPPRRFSHHQITGFPEQVANKTWAKDVLRVLQRATEDKPEARYQTVQAFWEELSDASLPPTQPLRRDSEGEDRQRPVSKQLTEKIEAIPDAPPRPRFDSRDMIRQTQFHGNGLSRPRIVVPLSVAKNLKFPTKAAASATTIYNPAAGVPEREPPPLPRVAPPSNIIPPPETQSGGRLTRALIALLIILAFAGILLATHYYVSRRRAQNPPPTGNTESPLVQKEGAINRPVNLRSKPDRASDSLRVLHTGARVRILSVNDNNSWYEVEVLADETGAPDADTRGWIRNYTVDLN